MKNLNAKIEYLGNGIVEIETALGNIRGNITQVKNGIATIQTNLGSVKVSLGSISVKLDKVKSLADLIPRISSQQQIIINKSSQIESDQRKTEAITIAILIIVLIGLGLASYAVGVSRRSSEH